MLYRRRRDGLKGLGGLRQCRLKSLPPLVADGGLCERVLLKFVQGSNRSLEGMIRLKGTVCLRVERNHTKGSVVKIPKRGIAEVMRPTGSTGARRAISGGHAGKSVAYSRHGFSIDRIFFAVKDLFRPDLSYFDNPLV